MSDMHKKIVSEETTPETEGKKDIVFSRDAENSQDQQLLCWNCGEELETGQLFCPKCGSKSDAPIEKNDSIAEFNKNNEIMKKSKKKKLVVIISILFVVLLASGIAGYIFYFEPNARYTEAVSLYENGEYEEATVLFTGLGDFKDSADRVNWCENAIKQEKYDEAIAKVDSGNYDEAIKLLEDLGDFSDSKAKIVELENEYYELLQKIYAFVARGFEMDEALSNCVYNVLWTSDLYDANDSLAISNLYSGSSYRTYYYWSRYSNGYVYVVKYDTAEAFVSILDLTNENVAQIELLLLSAKRPPEKYKDIYDKVNSMCTTYLSFHSFVSKETNLGYSSYESNSDSKEQSVKNAMSNVTKTDSKIDDKVSSYAWE